MKLIEYLTFELDKSEFIFVQKFEELFSKIHNNRNVVNFTCRREDIKESIKYLFNHLSTIDDRKVILSSNGDTDMPSIKKEYLLQDNIPYSDDLQKSIETKSLDFFLEEGFLDGIPNNTIMFCHSVIKSHPSLHMIPLGRDFKGRSIIENMSFDKTQKDILCYYNCSIPPKSIHWYGRIREYIFLNIRDKKYIHVENIDINSSRDIGYNSFINYYTKISRSKFIIAPRGCGMDTYRLWDALYLGCIPVVVKYEGYESFEDLPILFVDKWEDYFLLDEDYLNSVWDRMINMDFNYEKLKFSYWEKIILSNI